MVTRHEFFAVHADGRRVSPNETLLDSYGRVWEYLGLVENNTKVYVKDGSDGYSRHTFSPQTFKLHVEYEVVETKVKPRSLDRAERLDKEYDK